MNVSGWYCCFSMSRSFRSHIPVSATDVSSGWCMCVMSCIPSVVGMRFRRCCLMYPRLRSVCIIAALVDGRPIPFSLSASRRFSSSTNLPAVSIALRSVASVYGFGGVVCFSVSWGWCGPLSLGLKSGSWFLEFSLSCRSSVVLESTVCQPGCSISLPEAFMWMSAQRALTVVVFIRQSGWKAAMKRRETMSYTCCWSVVRFWGMIPVGMIAW